MVIEDGDIVRIITWEGKVSDDLYTIECAKVDNKGLIQVLDRHNKPLKVIKRRIVPNSVRGSAVVIEAGSKFKAVCPSCPNVFDVTPANTQIRCTEHGIYQLHWLGDKPMSEVPTEVSELTAEKKDKPMAKTNKEPIKVNIPQLASLPNCELWEKNVVNFNHQKIRLVSYALVCTEEPARKLCFNTYDGTLGKRNTDTPLPIEAFLECSEDGVLIKAWHNIKDLTKERTSLLKKGYEVISNASSEPQT